jgi:protein-tyrosine phosphatase
MIRILFVCTGNTCRSPLAEAAARRIFGDHDDLEFSAGVAAADGAPASNHAQFVARDRGDGLGAHRSRALDPDLAADADLILTMTRGHADAARGLLGAEEREKVLTLAEAAGVTPPVDVDDPIGGTLEDYERTNAQIESMVEALRPRLDALRAGATRGEG